MQSLEQRLDDAGLVAIANRRPGLRIQPRAEIGPERHGKLGVRLDRRACGSLFDSAEVGKVDARCT
jgi:hypothetical protein